MFFSISATGEIWFFGCCAYTPSKLWPLVLVPLLLLVSIRVVIHRHTICSVFISHEPVTSPPNAEINSLPELAYSFKLASPFFISYQLCTILRAKYTNTAATGHWTLFVQRFMQYHEFYCIQLHQSSYIFILANSKHKLPSTGTITLQSYTGSDYCINDCTPPWEFDQNTTTTFITIHQQRTRNLSTLTSSKSINADILQIIQQQWRHRPNLSASTSLRK